MQHHVVNCYGTTSWRGAIIQSDILEIHNFVEKVIYCIYLFLSYDVYIDTLYHNLVTSQKKLLEKLSTF